jgi:predicted PurR-regulated permease PerM
MDSEKFDSLYLKRIFMAMIVFSFVILSFFLLKPVALSIIFGFLLAFIFSPVYNFVLKKTKSKNLSASLLCIFLVLLILLPIWFFTPIFLKQSLQLYVDAQHVDFATPLKSIFPSFFASQEFSSEIGSIMNSFVTKTARSLVETLSGIILNFVTILLQMLVVFFTFFFALRDKDKIVPFLRSVSPFSSEVEDKLFEYSRGITSSLLYGQIIIGVIQGIIIGIGFFIFKAPNALFLTILSVFAGILPIVGPTLIWIPTSIYLLIAGNAFPALGIVFFGVFSSTIDNFLRPLIVSQRTNVPSPVILVGMIGGFLYFGALGILLGPLILSYLLVGIELYRKKGKSKKGNLFCSD